MKYSVTQIDENKIDFTFFDQHPFGTTTHEFYCWPAFPYVSNLYFVNIPKNATSTVRAWGLEMSKHGAKISNPESFTILRDPYGRLKSAFAYGTSRMFQNQYTVADIGKWLTQGGPEKVSAEHAQLFMHFVPQEVFLRYSPCHIERYYHTGETRELRHRLIDISGVKLNWRTENKSLYTEQFTNEYNAWFGANREWIDVWLAGDILLYKTQLQQRLHKVLPLTA